MIRRQTHTLLVFLAALVLLSLSCNGLKEVILPHTETIFPLEAGRSTITYVIDTTFNTSGPVVERYYKKEEIGGMEEDLRGRTLTLLQTYRSPEEAGLDFQFEPDQLWTLYKDPGQTGTRYAERIEDNVRTRVLKFPVHPFISWNGNLYNNRGAEAFYYANIDTTVTVRGQTFDNCVFVVQKADTTSAISFRYGYEIYAPNVGRIKKYEKIIVNDLPPNGAFNPDKSSIYLEEVVAYE